MNLTKGQKDALIRKAESIIREKRASKESEYAKEWKPSKEGKKKLDAIKKVIDFRDKMLSAAKEAGGEINYYSAIFDIDGFRESINFNNCDNSAFESFIQNLAKQYATLRIQNEFPEPNTWDIQDELELRCLAKDFDVDAFLKKYQDL